MPLVPALRAACPLWESPSRRFALRCVIVSAKKMCVQLMRMSFWLSTAVDRREAAAKCSATAPAPGRRGWRWRPPGTPTGPSPCDWGSARTAPARGSVIVGACITACQQGGEQGRRSTRCPVRVLLSQSEWSYMNSVLRPQPADKIRKRCGTRLELLVRGAVSGHVNSLRPVLN